MLAARAVSPSARSILAALPPELARRAEATWNEVAWQPCRGGGDFVFEADYWLQGFARPLLEDPLPLDLKASDEDIRDYARQQAERFRWRSLHGMDVFAMLKMAEGLGLQDWQRCFRPQLQAGRLDAIAARLQDPRWWVRFFRRSISRRYEHLVRAEYNLIHSHGQLYVSREAVRRRRRQLKRNAALMEAVRLINELGQAFTLAELVEKSNANPAIRRAELMVRIAGFETIARDLGHVGEFVTITAPSRFHRAHYKGGVPNAKYDSTSPLEAQGYLKKVWARIQSELARAGIKIYGFRVVEPHHEGCPHWHGLFFMPREHRKTFRRIVARHACRDSREELGLYYFETVKAAREAARQIQAEQKQRAAAIGNGAKAGTLAAITAGLPLEDDFWANAGSAVFRKVGKRVECKAIDWRRGTAAGYIAKYISKNIDGKNAFGESVGLDFEAGNGESVVETAERVAAWASVWGIRQFQQIGGAPVSVWRELRREGMTEGDGNDTIVRAAHAADAGNWAKFVMIMGGPDAPRKEQPVRLFKEEVVEFNCYGEPKAPMVRGVFETDTGLIKISRIHEWTIQQNGGSAAAWTRVNNSTKSKFDENSLDNQEFVKASNSKESLRKERWDIDHHRKWLYSELRMLRHISVDAESQDFCPQLLSLLKEEMGAAENELEAIKNPPRIRRAEAAEAVAAAKTAAAMQAKLSREREQLGDYLGSLDRLSPPLRREKPVVQDWSHLKTRYRRFAAPKRYPTAESVLADMDGLFAELDERLDQLADWDYRDC